MEQLTSYDVALFYLQYLAITKLSCSKLAYYFQRIHACDGCQWGSITVVHGISDGPPSAIAYSPNHSTLSRRSHILITFIQSIITPHLGPADTPLFPQWHQCHCLFTPIRIQSGDTKSWFHATIAIFHHGRNARISRRLLLFYLLMGQGGISAEFDIYINRHGGGIAGGIFGRSFVIQCGVDVVDFWFVSLLCLVRFGLW